MDSSIRGMPVNARDRTVQSVFHKRRTVTLALVQRIYAYHRQIPVRHDWVGASELLEDRG